MDFRFIDAFYIMVEIRILLQNKIKVIGWHVPESDYILTPYWG